jgi:hypothetical protein
VSGVVWGRGWGGSRRNVKPTCSTAPWTTAFDYFVPRARGAPAAFLGPVRAFPAPPAAAPIAHFFSLIGIFALLAHLRAAPARREIAFFSPLPSPSCKDEATRRGPIHAPVGIFFSPPPATGRLGPYSNRRLTLLKYTSY